MITRVSLGRKPSPEMVTWVPPSVDPEQMIETLLLQSTGCCILPSVGVMLMTFA